MGEETEEPWQMTRKEYTSFDIPPLPENLEALDKRELLGLTSRYTEARRELFRRRLQLSEKGIAIMYPSPEYEQWSRRLGKLCIKTPKEEIIEVLREFDRTIREEFNDFLGRQHKEFVKLALEEGKPVPLEVLRDYPDLLEKYGKKIKREKKSRLRKPKQTTLSIFSIWG